MGDTIQDAANELAGYLGTGGPVFFVGTDISMRFKRCSECGKRNLTKREECKYCGGSLECDSVKSNNMFGFIILAILSIAFTGIGGCNIYKNIKTTVYGETFEGTVIGHKEVWSSGSEGRSGQWMYYPIVSFAYKGITLKKKLNYGANPPPLSVGERVNLYYNHDDPDHIIVQGLIGIWIIPVMFLFAGFGLIWVTIKVGRS